MKTIKIKSATLSVRTLKVAYDETISDGTATVPNVRIRFLPSFCFSSSFFLRVISPP